MRKFNELGISSTLDSSSLIGHKIDIDSILNKEIRVHAFQIKPSKFTDKGSGRCLHLQIEYKDEMRVVFTGSVVLMNLLEQVPKHEFPFTTTIVKDNKRIDFT